MPCLCIFRTKEGVRSLHITIKNHDTHTEKGKYIYKALTLHGKQLLLKQDQSQSHKSAIWLPTECLPGKDILLKLLSPS